MAISEMIFVQDDISNYQIGQKILKFKQNYPKPFHVRYQSQSVDLPKKFINFANFAYMDPLKRMDELTK